jgi:hypothetical protein
MLPCAIFDTFFIDTKIIIIGMTSRWRFQELFPVKRAPDAKDRVRIDDGIEQVRLDSLKIVRFVFVALAQNQVTQDSVGSRLASFIWIFVCHVVRSWVLKLDFAMLFLRTA